MVNKRKLFLNINIDKLTPLEAIIKLDDLKKKYET